MVPIGWGTLVPIGCVANLVPILNSGSLATLQCGSNVAPMWLQVEIGLGAPCCGHFDGIDPLLSRQTTLLEVNDIVFLERSVGLCDQCMWSCLRSDFIEMSRA